MRGFLLGAVHAQAPIFLVGASPLAMAAGQSRMMLVGPPLSRAGSLPQGNCGVGQFFSGINTASFSPITMKTSSFAGSVALAFFETKCSEPAASYQNSPAL